MSHRKIVSIDLMGHFCLIPDPRQRKVKHPLINILFIGVIASLCGVDDFVGMAAFCKAKRKWFSGTRSRNFSYFVDLAGADRAYQLA